MDQGVGDELAHGNHGHLGFVLSMTVGTETDLGPGVALHPLNGTVQQLGQRAVELDAVEVADPAAGGWFGDGGDRQVGLKLLWVPAQRVQPCQGQPVTLWFDHALEAQHFLIGYLAQASGRGTGHGNEVVAQLGVQIRDRCLVDGAGVVAGTRAGGKQLLELLIRDPVLAIRLAEVGEIPLDGAAGSSLMGDSCNLGNDHGFALEEHALKGDLHLGCHGGACL